MQEEKKRRQGSVRKERVNSEETAERHSRPIRERHVASKEEVEEEEEEQ